jgi:uncharacterized membrane protein YbaN (DUF454 family)
VTDDKPAPPPEQRDAAAPPTATSTAPSPGAGDGDRPRLHSSPLVRALLVAGGIVCIALGAAGLVLPVLPTTPFMLLAAFCFARASPALHRRLVESRHFGPTIVEWERHRSLPWRTKLVAIALMVTTLALSIVFFVRPLALKLLLAGVGVGLAIWLYRIPSRDRPRS